MRMLSDTLAGGGVVDQGPAAPATAPPLLTTPLSASTTTGFFADARMGLALGALLCALVGTIYLLQFSLHYCGGGRRSALPPGGMKETALIRRMPVAVYEAAAEGGVPAGAECAICLGEFEDGDAVRLLPRCRHRFHVRCIDTWLSAHSSCPICRDSLLDEGASATAAGEETTAWSSFIAGMLYLA